MGGKNLGGASRQERLWQAKQNVYVYDGCDVFELNGYPVLPLTFEPLPLGVIKPRGWIRQQLQLMADGLPGHLHEFYRLVRNATWGGDHEEYSILNEAWPYYINGLVPLAYALNDEQLLNDVNQQIIYVLLKQFPDGWLGPESELLTRNFWGRYPFFLAAAQYVEAANIFESTMMLRAMHNFVDIMHRMLKDDYQGYVWKQGDRFDEQWGRSRAADMVVALQWLHENYPANNRVKIHECMFLIYQKAYDWSWFFSDNNFLKEDVETYPPELINPLFPFLHVVNVAQGLKSPAVMGRLVHDKSLLESSRRGVEMAFKYHGTSSGALVGDERLSGNSPARGSELCSVVEAMFSLSTLYQIMGDNSFADRLESAAFNALPAMVMPRWWARQYVAQINQPYSYELQNTHFWNVGAFGTTFGLETNYPCCTVNFPQGYPKLLSNSWVKTPSDNGLAHTVLIPSDLRVVLRHIQGDGVVENLVHIRCETNYPFAHLIKYHVDSQEGFNLSIRIPEWVNTKNPRTGIYLDNGSDFLTEEYVGTQASSSSGRDPSRLKPDQHTGLHKISLPAGPFSFSVYLSPFPSKTDTKPVIKKRPNSAVAVTHGSLLFAHTLHGIYTPRRPANYQRPGEAPPEAHDWTIVPREQNQSSSYEHGIRENGRWRPWNIAIDPSTARVHEYPNLYSNPDCRQSGIESFDETQHSTKTCYNDWPNPIWEEFHPPISVTVLACEIEWNMSSPVVYEDDGRGGRKAVRGGSPLSPPPAGRKGRHKCAGRAFPVELKPFGSAKIRVAEFPVVDLSPESDDLVDS